MVSCQEPSPLKGSKHSLQCHPHDAALVNELSLCPWGWRQGVASKSAVHCRHMKRQPFLHGGPCRGCLLCHRRRHLQLQLHRCCCCRHCCRRNCPSLLPLLWVIAAVAVSHCCRHLCCVAVSHHCSRCPCRRPLPSLSPSAIAVAIAIGYHPCHAVNHFVALAQQELYSTN